MPQPDLPLPRARTASSQRRPTRSNVVGLNHPQRQQVRQFNHQNSIPVWLQSLLTIQRVAKIAFASIFGLSLIGYGYTVYTQDVWKQQHGQLRRLQVQERQQGVMNENLKQQMAKSAEDPQSELVPPDPTQILFVPSAPPRLTKPLPAPASAQTSPTSQPPSGY